MIKKTILIIIFILFYTSINAQKINKYEHCNCTETISYSEKGSKDGNYEFVCDNSFSEKGSYKNGHKDGIWIVKNTKGKLISKIEYSNGKLNGIYELYYFDGEPKLNASFINNKPVGEWKYYTKKGKIIKQGKYQDGKTIGIWKVYDKKGKKVIAEYNFDTNESIKSNNTATIKKSYIPRDDESGEYVIIYYPNRQNLKENIPLGGNIYSNKMFIDLLNVPFVLMNTLTDYDFKIKGTIKDGILIIDKIDYLENSGYSSKVLSFPYIAQTNSPKKIKKITHTETLISKMKERIFETIMVIGPWVSENNTEIEIHIPFVLNNIN